MSLANLLRRDPPPPPPSFECIGGPLDGEEHSIASATAVNAARPRRDGTYILTDTPHGSAWQWCPEP